MPERIRDALVARELAAQAGTEQTPELFLSDLLTPIIFGPQRPPLAASGYFPGVSGVFVAAVAANTSHTGIFVSGTNADSIIRVNSIKIQNTSGTAQAYEVRRLDDISGFSILALVPGYINAGSPLSGGVFSMRRSNTVAAQGVVMGLVTVEAESEVDVPGPWIINNGGLLIHPTSVNKPAQAWFNYEHWPSIRRQPAGG